MTENNEKKSDVFTSTYFGLLLTHGTTEIPLADIGYMLGTKSASWLKKQAAAIKLPFPVYRCSSAKAPWMVDAKELADYLVKQKRDAQLAFTNLRLRG